MIVDVEVENGVLTKVTSVRGDEDGEIDPAYVFDGGENASYLNLAIYGTPRRKGVLAQIQAKLDAGAEVASIDTLSGATISSRAILAAFQQAVNAQEATPLSPRASAPSF